MWRESLSALLFLPSWIFLWQIELISSFFFLLCTRKHQTILYFGNILENHYMFFCKKTFAHPCWDIPKNATVRYFQDLLQTESAKATARRPTRRSCRRRFSTSSFRAPWFCWDRRRECTARKLFAIYFSLKNRVPTVITIL